MCQVRLGPELNLGRKVKLRLGVTAFQLMNRVNTCDVHQVLPMCVSRSSPLQTVQRAHPSVTLIVPGAGRRFCHFCHCLHESLTVSLRRTIQVSRSEILTSRYCCISFSTILITLHYLPCLITILKSGARSSHPATLRLLCALAERSIGASRVLRSVIHPGFMLWLRSKLFDYHPRGKRHADLQ